jgi:uncharacterized protein
MIRHELDSKALYGCFVSGGNEIMRKREAINKINVFPVADGDTGTNLAMTMGAVIERSSPMDSAGSTMRSMAQAALTGARGNSGIIFAQFFAGLSEHLGDTTTISSDLFAEAAMTAERRARESVLVPVEGTILTVIKDWVRELQELKHLREFGLIFQRTLKAAKRSLDNTPNLLPELKRRNVVDAGAEGFFRFLSGATKYLVSDSEAIPAAAGRTAELPASAHGGEYPLYRYCVEALIRGRDIDLRGLKSELPALGDCGIAAGGGDLARAHVHTDDPARAVARLASYGELAEQKVDDMLREYEAAHSRKYPIALVTDSVCDLPRSLIDAYQIHVVPLNISIGGAQYLDGLTIRNDRIYEAMEARGAYPTTAQPSPAAFRLLYSFLSTYYDSVIAIHVSGKLSGTFGLSRKEAERISDKRITVIDSRNDSGSQGLIVLRAAELIAEGRSHDEVVAAVEDSIPKARILVGVPTLKYMVKGGRVSPLKGALARLLGLKPIVSLDEEGGSRLIGKAFSTKSNLRKIVSLVEEFVGDGKIRSFGVVHAGDSGDAGEFASRLEAALGRKPLFIQEISPIIALNAGPGTMAAVVMKE